MIRVVTLMYGSAWDRYGKAFYSSYKKFWPASFDLVIVTDRSLPVGETTTIDLASVPGYSNFISRHRANGIAHGMNRPAGSKVDQHGYSWKHDAVKWAPQAMAPRMALTGLSLGDVLVWFDADVETTSLVPPGWIGSLLGSADVAMLQRTGTHSEIGFYALRIGQGTVAVLDEFAALYTSDRIFKMRETHSAFAFDRALESVRGVTIRNLSPNGKGHVWPRTPLAAHTIHKKGKRKDAR